MQIIRTGQSAHVAISYFKLDSTKNFLSPLSKPSPPTIYGRMIKISVKLQLNF